VNESYGDRFLKSSAEEKILPQEKLRNWGFRRLPIFQPREYRRPLVGLADEREKYIFEIVEQAKENARSGRYWRKWWGFGKSAFLWNICVDLNQRYFLNERLVEEEAKNRLILALLFDDASVPLNLALQKLFAGAQDIPFHYYNTPAAERVTFKEVVRKVVFSLLLYSIEAKRLEAEKILPKEYLAPQVKVTAIMSYMDNHPELLPKIMPLLLGYIQESVSGKGKAKQELANGLCALLHAPTSEPFEKGWENVRNRINYEWFFELLKLARIFAVFVFDQWEYASKGQIKIANQITSAPARFPANHLAIVTRMRWEVTTKPSLILDMTTLMEGLGPRIGPRDLNKKEAREFVTSILNEFRDGSPIPSTSHPLTDDAVDSLIESSVIKQFKAIKPRRLGQLVQEVLDVAFWRCDNVIDKKLLGTKPYKERLSMTLMREALETEEKEEAEAKAVIG